jgi:type II secretory pathway pseudopilin PulG
MIFRLKQNANVRARSAFTLAEVIICLGIFALVTAGIVYGYTQSNRFAQWSAMSLAAQSLAAQGVEQARTAVWQSSSETNIDDLPASTTNTLRTNYIDTPSGQLLVVTNYIIITAVSTNPPLRQIRTDCAWQFPLTGKWFTNTVITQRAQIQ